MAKKNGAHPPANGEVAPTAEMEPAPSAQIVDLRHDPAAIRRLFETGEYPYKTPMRTGAYEEHMLQLQRELPKAQRWVAESGERIVVLFEGRDGAGGLRNRRMTR